MLLGPLLMSISFMAQAESGSVTSLLMERDLSRLSSDDPYGPSRSRTFAEKLSTFRPRRVEYEPQSIIHAILLFDDQAIDIQAAVQRDRSAIVGLLSSGVSSNRLKLKVLSNADLEPAAIIRTVLAVECNSADVLLVYYSGHGLTETTDEVLGEVLNVNGIRKVLRSHHMLSLTKGVLARGNLRLAMESRRARLKVLVTDCCRPPEKNLVRSDATRNPEFKVFRKLDLGHPNKQLIDDIFGRQVGFIDISTGIALSDSKMGGILTHSFVAACCYQYPTFVHQPRLISPTSIQIHRRAQTRLDYNNDGVIDWREFLQLWMFFVSGYSAGEQSVLMDLFP